MSPVWFNKFPYTAETTNIACKKCPSYSIELSAKAIKYEAFKSLSALSFSLREPSSPVRCLFYRGFFTNAAMLKNRFELLIIFHADLIKYQLLERGDFKKYRVTFMINDYFALLSSPCDSK